MLHDEDEINFLPSIPWPALVFSLLGLFAFVPLGLLLGLCRLEAGARAFTPHASFWVGLYFPLYALLVHATIVWPLVTLVLTRQRPSGVMRAMLSVAFVSFPLLSFGYYVSNDLRLEDLHDLFTVLIPASLMGYAFYARTERSWVFSLVVALGTFIPFFVINDLLSPFTVLVTYSSTGAGFYFWRALVPVLVVASALIGFSSSKGGDERILEAVGASLGCLAVYSFVVQYALPFLVSRQSGADPVQVSHDLTFVGSAVGALLLYRRRIEGYWFLVGFAILECIIASSRIGVAAYRLQVNFIEMARLFHSFVLLAAFGLVLGLLSRRRVRDCFSIAGK